MTSAIQMVADRLTPTRQCTNVAVPSDLPFSAKAEKIGKLLKIQLDGYNYNLPINFRQRSISGESSSIPLS